MKYQSLLSNILGPTIVGAMVLSSCTHIDLSRYKPEYRTLANINLRLNGFYSIPTDCSDGPLCVDRPIFLYEDGSALALLNARYDYDTFEYEIVNSELENFIHPYSGWGSYRVVADTIYIQYVAVINPVGLGRSIDVIDVKALVTSDSSFSIISAKGPFHTRLVYEDEVHMFTESTKPDSTNWVKKRVLRK